MKTWSSNARTSTSLPATSAAPVAPAPLQGGQAAGSGRAPPPGRGRGCKGKGGERGKSGKAD